MEHTPIDPYLASPVDGAIREIPVVIVRYLPTKDGVNLDVSDSPSWWELGEISLDDLRADIDRYDCWVKFMLEEGTRFRGYKNPSAAPYIGYTVVDYITVYERVPRKGIIRVDDNCFPVFGPDHHRMFKRLNVAHYVNDLGVREIWLWTGGGFDSTWPSYDTSIHHPWDFWYISESNMSSPTTPNVDNSWYAPYDLPVYESTYIVYGQCFRRTQAEAVHNRGHQLEAMFSHAAQRQDGSSNLFWQAFVGMENHKQWVHGTGRCGDTHCPPNTAVDYDYMNDTLVESDIEDWRPDGTGAKTMVNAQTWGDLDYAWPGGSEEVPQRTESQWYIYWMQNMPGHGNGIPYGEGQMTNWWELVADWDTAMIAGLGLHE